MTQSKAVKVYGRWTQELVETLPDGTQRFRIFKTPRPPKKRRRVMADYHERFLELYGRKLNDKEIGKELGFDSSTISLYRRRHGLPSHHRVYSSRISEHKTRFVELYNEGLSDGKIGEALGFHKGTVSIYRRKKLGLPAHFTFGRSQIVFSYEDKKKIAQMRLGGAAISVIAREFGIGTLTMNKKCKEMGMDTSADARGWIRTENDCIKLWNYLEDHGPTTQREIKNKLGISGRRLQDYVVHLWDIFEQFKFAVGTGRGSRGGVKYGGYEIYGDLSVNKSGLIISLRDDPRIIDYVAERSPFEVKTGHDAATLVQHYKKQLGPDRARQVNEAKGYVYGDRVVKTPRERVKKFTDEQLQELYDLKLNDVKIARVLNVTASAIKARRKRLRLPALYKRGRVSVQRRDPLEGLDQIERKWV